MTTSNPFQSFDSWLIDRVFQPLADLLPRNLSVVQLGLSFQLGSVMLQAVAMFAPVLLLGAPFSLVMDTSLYWLMNLVFFLVMKRMSSLIRPGMMNPLRPMMYAIRLISLGFILYRLYRDWIEGSFGGLFGEIYTLSDVTFLIGIYLVACQPRPPGQKVFRRSKVVVPGVWGVQNGSSR